MGTSDETQMYNLIVLWVLTSVGLSTGIWEMVGESSVALSPIIGESILKEVEKKSGKTFSQTEPVELLSDFTKVFNEEFGNANDFTIERSGDTIKIILKDALGTNVFNLMKEHGVKKLFSHPFLCSSLALLLRNQIQASGEAFVDSDSNDQTIVYKLR